MANYKDLHGFQIKHRSSDPANPIAGEIWYNTTSQTLKVAPKIGAWASSGDLGTARYNLVGCGTLTAGLVFAGRAPATGVTEEYDGSSWTESGDCNTARQQAAGFGTQTAAVGTGGFVDGSGRGIIDADTVAAGFFKGIWRREGSTIVMHNVVNLADGSQNFDIITFDARRDTLKHEVYILR